MPTLIEPYRSGFQHGGGGHFGLWVLALFLDVLFWGALIVGVVLLVRFLLFRDRTPVGRRGPGPVGPRSAALDEIELRYARGEIQRDDYLQRRLDLTNASGWGGGPPYGPPPSGPYGPGPGGPYGPTGRGGPYGTPPGGPYGQSPYGPAPTVGPAAPLAPPAPTVAPPAHTVAPPAPPVGPGAEPEPPPPT